MKQNFQTLIDHFFAGLSTALLSEGFLLYIMGSITVTYVQVRFGQEFREGFKGRNKLWDIPEHSVYLWSMYSPHVVMASAFLGFDPPEAVWWYMGANLAFALLGRYGFEQLVALRFGGGSGGSTTITQKKKESETIIEEKKDDSGGGSDGPVNI